MDEKYLKQLYFNDEIITKINRWNEYLKRGSYADARQVTDTYNYVFQDVKQKVYFTTCGSCIKQRITELYKTLQHWLEYNESKNASETSYNALESTNEVSDDKTITEEEKEPQNANITVKRGRPKKGE